MNHSELRVAVCHFHLRTGGVTRVIEHTLEALTDRNIGIAVLTGEAPVNPLPAGVHCQVIPGLAYEETRALLDGTELAAQMQAMAGDLLGASPDVWHFHNHSLGKNLAAPAAIRTLARGGQRILLHIHDFAEEGRPALYKRLLADAADGDPGRLSELLYPLAAQIHYAVLNGRDQGVLIRAGIPHESIHLLHNAVWLPRSQADSPAPSPFDPQQRLWLYPTRAIRRKNLGELLFWAALDTEQGLYATTQAPQNPAERPVYERWKALANDLNLPVAFELGVRYEGDFLHLTNQLNLTRYGDRLLDVYRQLSACAASSLTAADGSALLDAFLAPDRLFLLKT